MPSWTSFINCIYVSFDNILIVFNLILTLLPRVSTVSYIADTKVELSVLHNDDDEKFSIR